MIATHNDGKHVLAHKVELWKMKCLDDEDIAIEKLDERIEFALLLPTSRIKIGTSHPTCVCCCEPCPCNSELTTIGAF